MKDIEDIEGRILEEFSNYLDEGLCLVIRVLPSGRLRNHSRNPLVQNETELSREDIFLQCVGAMNLNPSIPVFVVFKDRSGQFGVQQFDGTPNSIFGENAYVRQ
ncbi:MAG: hypothetical protein V3574_03085 [Candidatus Moraniibacteriota bacterium]